jgi:hypothetical protein
VSAHSSARPDFIEGCYVDFAVMCTKGERALQARRLVTSKFT